MRGRYSGPPMTAAARVRLIVWCLDGHRQVEPDPAEMAERYGVETTIGARTCLRRMRQPAVDMVVTGTER